ncbi:GNAT family N-acetyltransferase [Tateyamaria sp.]|uniref:GNAT family N-acetyltransferase n=1 Tax=Tateyamaria sp. TaxID=1929288 RepID=UPI00329E54D8
MLSDGFHNVPAGKIAMVVTDLEMRVPQLRDVACPDGVRFEQINPDVAEYRDLFTRVGQDWLWFGRSVITDAALAEIINDPLVHIYTLTKDGEAEALLELDFRKNGECELAYFGVTAPLIGTGAGAYLMDRAIELAFLDGIDRFHLHTCSIDSPAALGFYRRSGFIPVRRSIEVADDPRLKHGYDRALAPHVPIIEG